MSGRHVAVVGAGWAGLAAAVELTRRGTRVTVLDANPRPGGRARTAPALGINVDNGQHIAIGAYSAVLELARTVEVDPARVFSRHPLALEQRDAQGVRLSLRAPAGAGRGALALAFASARGLSVLDKLALARHWRKLLRAPEPDTSVAEFLQRARQPAAAVSLLWEPLCLATMNSPPDRASARIFSRVLREAFDSSAPGASDLLLPASDLGASLPSPVVAWLEKNGAAVRLGERVGAIDCRGASRRAHTLTTAHGELDVDGIVLAVPPDACARLVGGIPELADLAATCTRFGTQPICTVYLRYPAHARLPLPLVGLTGTTVQWLVDRDTCAQPGIIGAVISADGPHMALDNDALVRLVAAEIARCVPELPPHEDARVIREKRATFEASVGIDAWRPGPATAVPGLVLAGDWTATGLPATLEGAVRSGSSAALTLHNGA